MFKLFSDVFKVLERHQKVGILKIQLIVIITAFTEVAGIATIGPFMALVSNPQTIEQEIFKNLYVLTNATSRDDFLVLMGGLVVSILLVSAIVATLSLRYIYLSLIHI